MATKLPMLRFTIFVRRHPSLTEEQFHDWWANKHAPMIKAWLVRHKVHRYVQYHTPSALRLQHFGQASTPTAEPPEPPARGVMDSDGAGEIVVPNAECLKALVEDPFYKEVVWKDEQEHLDPAGFRQTVGYEDVWVNDGLPIDSAAVDPSLVDGAFHSETARQA